MGRFLIAIMLSLSVGGAMAQPVSPPNGQRNCMPVPEAMSKLGQAKLEHIVLRGAKMKPFIEAYQRSPGPDFTNPPGKIDFVVVAGQKYNSAVVILYGVKANKELCDPMVMPRSVAIQYMTTI